MFVQIIQGKTSDQEGLRRQFDRWQSELKSGAKGFLGSTGGVADDGKVFMAARFESEQAARANSDRAEQGAWWSETEKYFDGPVDFVDSSDVDVQVEPSNDAGFVQVMQSTVRNRKRLDEINAEVTPKLEEMRPDLVGALSIWSGDKVYDLAYFKSEAEAREGEKKGMPDDQRELFEEWQSLAEGMTYLDLKNPWIE